MENIQQVRTVWNGDGWGFHLVCKQDIPVEDAPGAKTAGIDLAISDYLAIDYADSRSELLREQGDCNPYYLNAGEIPP